MPFVDDYISRRYDDTAVVIYEELRRCRDGPRNCYVTWLEAHLDGFPEEQRKKYSLVRTSPSSTATGETLEGSNRKKSGEEDLDDDDEGHQGAVVRTAASSKFCTIL